MHYPSLISTLVELLQSARMSAVHAVNRHHIPGNWLIGSYILDYERNGEDRAAYGSALLERLAQDLRSSRLKGLRVSRLRMTRRFYELYPQIRQSAIVESTATVPGGNSAVPGRRIRSASPRPKHRVARPPASLRNSQAILDLSDQTGPPLRSKEAHRHGNKCLKANDTIA
jgi:hypothetical protein